MEFLYWAGRAPNEVLLSEEVERALDRWGVGRERGRGLEEVVRELVEETTVPEWEVASG